MRDPRTWRAARLARRLIRLGRRRALDARLEAEFRHHLEAEAAERVRLGMSPDQARRTALRDFGGVDRYTEDVRDARGFRWLDDGARDAGYALRVLGRHPAFTSAVVLTFALGVGCTSAIFSLVDGILLRPLPYADPGQLVALWERNDQRGGGANPVSVATFEAWRDRARAFTDIAALIPAPVTLDGAPAERVKAAQVSPDYFRLLGVRPALGRDFDRREEADGGADVAILSDGFWRRRYGGDPSIVGRTLSADSRPFTVIGVMPPDFHPPSYGWMTDQPLWMPFGPTERNRSWGRVLHVVARLRPGVSVARAGEELASLSRQLAAERASNRGWSALAVPLASQMTGDVRRPLVVLFAAVALLLLMSTVNVASLVSAFARGRRHELGIRRAIGASSSRLVRQQLTESVLLGAGGALVGVAIAVAGTRALVATAPASVPRLDEVHVSGAVILFACAVSLVATIAFGLNGAVRAGRSPIGESSRATARLRGGRIVAAELAIGVVLTVLASLMSRSLANLRAVDVGFAPESLVAGRVSLPDARYGDDARRTAFFARLVQKARAIPGATNATLVTSRPLACCAPSTSVRDPSGSVPAESAPIADIRFVDSAYFTTMRIPILSGAVFEPSEPTEGKPHVVVSRTLARAVWGDADPIGHALSMHLFGDTQARVIGVVGDVHLVGPRTPVRPEAYLYTGRYPDSERDIVVRGTGDRRALLAGLRDAVASIDATIPLAGPTTLEAAIGETMADDRFTTLLLSAFSTIALTLAAVGVYGVVSGDVNRRRKEIGIRLALGASASRVTAHVLARAARPAAVGTGVGVCAALVAGRWMRALVFGVEPRDPWTLALVSCALLGVAVAATLGPAIRAARVSPVDVIRVD
jgi:putative ABC transport system permease protein